MAFEPPILEPRIISSSLELFIQPMQLSAKFRCVPTIDRVRHNQQDFVSTTDCG